MDISNKSYMISIDGFTGIIQSKRHNLDEIVQLCLTLLNEGYSVKINNLRIRVEYGPGYDLLIWGEGALEGLRVDNHESPVRF